MALGAPSIVWESEGKIPESTEISDRSFDLGNAKNRKVIPRPAVIRTTWNEYDDIYRCQMGSNFLPQSHNQAESSCTAVVAEHAAWEDRECDFLSENFVSFANYEDVYFPMPTPPCEGISAEIVEPNDEPKSPLTPSKIRSKGKRVFQKFWCATEEDDAQPTLPRPDEYRLQQNRGSQKRNKGSFKRKIWGNESFLGTLMTDECANMDERGGIRRRPKKWDLLVEDDLKKDETFYAPKRPPPILDFFMVLTSFFAAAILAYYSASNQE